MPVQLVGKFMLDMMQKGHEITKITESSGFNDIFIEFELFEPKLEDVCKFFCITCNRQTMYTERKNNGLALLEEDSAGYVTEHGVAVISAYKRVQKHFQAVSEKISNQQS